uniref:Uncharacterized protein n=1 Tax=Monodon monoceros TaxID=40151 RepID=A0A8C6BX89_MONMO
VALVCLSIRRNKPTTPDQTHSQNLAAHGLGRRGQLLPPAAPPETVLALFAPEMTFVFYPPKFSIESFLCFCSLLCLLESYLQSFLQLGLSLPKK